VLTVKARFVVRSLRLEVTVTYKQAAAKYR